MLLYLSVSRPHAWLHSEGQEAAFTYRRPVRREERNKCLHVYSKLYTLGMETETETETLK